MSLANLIRSFFHRPVRLTILVKGLLLVAVPLLFQLLLIGFMTVAGRQEHNSDVAVAHSQEVLRSSERLLTRLGDAQTSCRGYVLTGNPVFIEPFDRAKQELAQYLDALTALMGDSPKQQATVEKIAIKTARSLEFQTENMRLVLAGAKDEATTRIAGLSGNRQMDDIRQDIAAFQNEMERLADGRSRLRERNHTFFLWVIVIGTGVSMLLAVVLTVVFTREISQRLAAVIANTQRLVQGHELVPPIVGSDEIATMDQAFREMAQTLAQSQRKLIQQNQQKQLVLDAASEIAIIATDLQGVITTFNRGAERMLGYAAEELLNRQTPFVFHDQSEMRSRGEELSRELGRPIEGIDVFVTIPNRDSTETREWTYVRKDGQRLTVELVVTAARTADGGLLGYLGVATDITERKKAEMQRDRFFTLSLDMLCIANMSGYFVRLNPAFSETLGYTIEELLARPFLDFVHPDDKAATLEEVQKLSQGVPALRFVNRYHCQDGSWKWFAWKAQALPEEGLIYATARDITARKRIEDAMDHLQSALDEHAIVAITDARGQITFVNDKFCAISQYSREELIGQDHRIINSGHHPKAFIRDLWETITSGRVWKGEIKNRAKDGTFYWVASTIVPFLDSDGKPSQFIAIRTDITERKSFEQQLVQARQTAEFANRAKSDFLASMSHELRTPLNGILGMNELLLNTELTERQRQFVNACSTSGKTLLQQISDILDLSKIEAGKLELDLHECHLEALVYDIADVFSHSAQQKGYPLHCHVGPSVCVTAVCDGNRLRQILVNLIGNAMKFTTSGSVTVRAECVPQHDRPLTLRFSVTDTGVGIPEDRRDRLFAPFSQVDSSTSRKFGGTGLGLSICKQLVELMGGQLGVESQIGVGSTFWFEIPLQLVAEDAAIAQRRHLLADKRVLAVDGINRDRKQIGDCLQAWECSFEQVATLAEASEAIARAEAAGAPFAVVLADCRLAVGDEFVLLQNLATQSRLPIIGLDTNPDDETIAYLRQLGVRRVLRDPVRPSALFNALSAVLSIDAAHLPQDDGPGETREEQPSRLSGHVLVAEDNRINQMFIVELLKHCGCTCDVTANGDEALEARQHQRYDLVLMDCQMPGMDGFTASREIRRREAAGELPSRLPIIALTANALKGDRELCRDAGMDDYLSKPLNAQQLRAMLAKFLSPQTAE